MSYYLKPEESVQETVIRVAREQIGKAVDEIEDGELDRHEIVHQVRKRCKKLRGLIRVVRPVLGDAYGRENACFRDAARSLSSLRDAQSLIDTVDDLRDHLGSLLEPDFAADVRARLLERRRRLAEDVVGHDQQLDELRLVMQEAYQRVGNWELSGSGFDAVRGGLHKTYRRGHRAMHAAYRKPRAERFHEWRKRVKYHGYHLRLLRPIWKPLIRKQAEAAGELSDLLGDAHDLAVLRATLSAEPREFGDERQLEALLGLTEQRRKALTQQARPLGERLFGEHPDELVARFAQYWRAWEREARETPGITPRPLDS